MACNTQLGEHSHNPSGTNRGLGAAWGNSSVGSILQERQKRKEDEKKRKDTSFPYPSFSSFPKYKPSRKSNPLLPSSFKILSPLPKNGDNDPQNNDAIQIPNPDDNKFEIKGMVDILKQLAGEKVVEKTGEIPDSIPEGAKVVTRATLTLVHEITLPDGTVKAYTETYTSMNEDQR